MAARFISSSLALLPAILGACTATSPEEFAAIVEEARACQDGDGCQLAGGGQCTCDTPVNDDAVARIDEAAADVDCEGAVVECTSHQNVRCEDGRCRSDESQ